MLDYCKACLDSGWLWWWEIQDYDGPALYGEVDDTRYTCPYCKEEEEL